MVRNDHQLFGLLLNGDDASFKMIYNHFYPRLFYFIAEYILCNDLVENIVQDTFMTLWRKRFQLKCDTNLNAYLYTVAKNNALKKIREEKYRNKAFLDVPLSDCELELNIGSLSKLNISQIAFDEIKDIIEKTLIEMSPQCRQVFEMSRREGMKNREIAEAL